MKISFIIATLDRQEQLQNCIASIEKAHKFNNDVWTEVVVVFQGNITEETKTIFNGRQLVRAYCIEKRGLARARNFAIKQARGDWLIFIDDDAQIKEDFLNNFLKAQNNIKADAFCGRILEKPNGKSFGKCFERNTDKYLGWRDFRYFMGSSHILKKQLMNKIGLYDERFGSGSDYPAAEESDIFFRLKQSGLKVAYLPELILYHPIAENVPARKVFNYHRACGAMLTKQILNDIKHGGIYFFIISDIIFRSFARIIQDMFFSETIRIKNKRCHYVFVFLGVLRGSFDYLRENK